MGINDRSDGGGDGSSSSDGRRSDAGIDDPADLGAATDTGSPAQPDLVTGMPDVPASPDTNPSPPDVPIAVDMAPSGCAAGSKLCQGVCVPNTACCVDADCAGGFACIAAACSTTACRTGNKRCGAACIPMATCCPAEGCCSDADCGSCKRCTAGACVNQAAGDDLKKECPTGACHPGRCNGNGACNVTPDAQNGPSCMGECVRCQGGACRPRTGMCSTGQLCDEGRCPPRPPFSLRINVNGPQHGAFTADPGPGGICMGSPFANLSAINGTNDDPLYQSEMFGAPLTCAVGAGALPAGPYQVVLHFAEIYWGPGCPGGTAGTGARVFDIQLEGTTVATKVDVFSEAGCAAAPDGTGRPVTKRFPLTISDGTLNLNFPATANNAKLSAIEILSDW